MSNLFQSIASGVGELKNFYQGPIVDQFNQDCNIYRGSEKIKQGWSGLQVVRPWRVRRNQGVGATSDGGILPAIGRQTVVQATIQAKYNYLRFGVTGPMISASRNDAGSFVRSAAYELEMGYKDVMFELNRQFADDGNGTLALVSANVIASNVLVISGRSSGEDPLKFLDVGAVIDITDGAGNIVASGVSVNTAAYVGSALPGNSNPLTATLTLSAAVSASANYTIIRSNSLGNEIQGLLYSVTNVAGTIYGVSSSTYPILLANVLDNQSNQMSLDGMQNIWNQGQRRGGAKYSSLYCDFDSQRMYQKLLTANKRFNNTVEGDGGFAKKDQSYLEFNGLPIVADKDVRSSTMFFLPMDTFKTYVLEEMAFADETGTMYIAQTSTDSFEVRVRQFCNLFNEQPSATGVYKNYVSP